MNKKIQRILLVDDDPDYLDLLTRYCKNNGYICMSATSGAQALPFVSANPPPDLIVSDLDMPEGDGLALLAAVQEKAGPQPCPFILITGNAVPGTRTKALADGAFAMLEKPFRPKALLELIQALETA